MDWSLLVDSRSPRIDPVRKSAMLALILLLAGCAFSITLFLRCCNQRRSWEPNQAKDSQRIWHEEVETVDCVPLLGVIRLDMLPRSRI